MNAYTVVWRTIAHLTLGPYHHDKLAPTKLFALHIPSFVRMRCVDFVSGSIHAASRLSRVRNPWSAPDQHSLAYGIRHTG